MAGLSALGLACTFGRTVAACVPEDEIGLSGTFLRFEAAAYQIEGPLSFEQRTRPKEKFSSSESFQLCGVSWCWVHGPGTQRMYFRHIYRVTWR